ncbi:MAG: thioredoxin family protein [Bdellovibrionales bacterium]|nr:thioredoxin family protein [Bdellovibrionales bacterium]
MTKLLIFLSLSFGANSLGRGSLQTQTTNNTYTANLAEGFHFNKEAPNKLIIDKNTIKMTSLTSREIQFGPLPAKWNSGRAALYVCDDALTFCEPNFIDLSKNTKEIAQKNTINENFGIVNEDGFIQDDLESALQLAKKRKALLLVDFSARWCPGCIRYENETFHTEQFKTLTKNYIKVKIDVDRFENIKLSKEFSISAIPTLLVLNGKRQELDRLIDYQPTSILKPFLQELEASPITISELKKHADTKPGYREILAKRLVTAGKYSESLKYFSKRDVLPPEYLYAKVKYAAEQFKLDSKNKDHYIATLKEAIQEEPKSSRSIVWRTDLISLLTDRKEIEAEVKNGVRLADELLNDSEKLQVAVKTDLVGEYTDYEKFFVAIERAELIEAAYEGTSKSKNAWKVAAKIGTKYKIPPQRFGPSLRLLIIVMAAEDYKKADTLSISLLKQYPDNGDLLRRRLKVLIATNKLTDAIILGKSALENSYGRNEVWVAESLAKALVANNELDKADSLISGYLQRTDVNWTNLQSTKKSFEDMVAQIKAKRLSK